jgi:hypothetical protein
MKSYSCYFARTPKIEAARAVFSTVEILPDSTWLMCNYRRDDSPPDDVVLLGKEYLTITKSAQLGEVIFVYGDTSCDGFVYEHAVDGKLLRKLVWFPLLDDWSCAWICVEGKSEYWETQLFRLDDLVRCLENEREKLADEGRTDEIAKLETDIKQSWDSKQIMQGKTYPYCDGTVTFLVERSYSINRPLLS